MRLSFLGAAQTVTGSCHLLDVGDKRVLLDCGMFQGHDEERNWRPLPFDPKEIHALLLSHAHIDHSGAIPRLVKEGFQGRIIATKATLDLCQIMLLDAAHLQEMEAQYESRRRLRKGDEPVEPLFTMADAARAFPLFSPVDYGQEVEVAPGVHALFLDAGHILGSSIVQVGIEEEDLTLAFSGDLGRYEGLILRDPTPIPRAHVLLVESTYGNRFHKSLEESEEELVEIVNRAHREGGKVLMPAFAVGRTQEILYILNNAYNQGKIPPVPVYLDSPLAIAATEIFVKHPECFDGETLRSLKKDPRPFSFPEFKYVRSAEESKDLNNVEGGIIIAGSGMCTGGRIKHHLKHNLWKHTTHLVFTGFQAKGTLGRNLVDGAQRVHIFGERIQVNAQVHTLGGFSAHADQGEILQWLGHFQTPPSITFVVHGEPEASQVLAEKLEATLGWKTHLPTLGESVDLSLEVVGPFHPPRMEVEVPPQLERDFQRAEEVLKDLQGALEEWRSHPYQPTLPFKAQRVLRFLKKARDEI